MAQIDKADLLIEGLRKSEVLEDFVNKLPDDAMPNEITIKLLYKHKTPKGEWESQARKIYGDGRI